MLLPGLGSVCHLVVLLLLGVLLLQLLAQQTWIGRVWSPSVRLISRLSLARDEQQLTAAVVTAGLGATSEKQGGKRPGSSAGGRSRRAAPSSSSSSCGEARLVHGTASSRGGSGATEQQEQGMAGTVMQGMISFKRTPIRSSSSNHQSKTTPSSSSSSSR